MTDQTETGPVNDMPELYAVQHAITDAGGTLTPEVHRAIDALRETWDAALRRAQAEVFQYRTALQGAARRAAVPAGQAPDTERAVECSAQHHRFDDGRLCIRAAQHRGDHIDERGFHWSDTVAVYPLAPAVVSAMPGQAENEATSGCNCPHPADEHSVYGCADGCACEWMPSRKPAAGAQQPKEA